MDRLWSKVDKTPGLGIGDCWEWKAGLVNGYGKFWLNDKAVRAHRVTAWLAGLIPSLDSPLEIDHVKCQNKKCVNPAHLQAMTKSEHSKQTHTRGEAKYTSGENHYSAKLNEKQVWNIHELHEASYTQKEIAEVYGIAQPTISDILTGRTWSHIYKEYHDCI